MEVITMLLLPKAGNVLWVAINQFESILSENKMILWSMLMNSMENLAFIVMIQFAFIDMPTEIIGHH